MKISHLIFFSILFILVSFSITTYINFRQSKEVRNNTEYLARSATVVRQSNRLQRNVFYMERGLRGYLLTGEIDFIRSCDSAIKENRSIINELMMLVPDTTEQRKYLFEIQNLHEQWVNGYADPLRQAKALSGRSAKDLKAFTDLYKEEQVVREEEQINWKLGKAFQEFNNYEYRNRDNRRQELAHSEQRTKDVSILLTALSILVGLLIAYFLARHIGHRINRMVQMANTIAKGNYQVTMNDKGKDELSHLSRALNHMAKVLEESFSQLRRKNEELDKYAHIVSHDLKAPLRGIDNVVSWIEEDHHQELPSRVKEYLELIKGRIRRSENLIEGILSYSRIGKKQGNKELLLVEELIREILANTALPPTIEVKIATALPQLYTDKILLMQVFSNLISNAVKYNDKDQGQIIISCRERNDHYEFAVADNGPGIAKAYHDKIFVIFQTLQDRDSFESTGVGLAIVKKILDDRNESITVNSEPDKGAVFTFTWSKS